MFRFINVGVRNDRVDPFVVIRIGIVAVWFLASIASGADSNVKSHPPQRPLPKATDRILTAGPAYYVDPAQGDDANDGSITKQWKSMQYGVRRLQPGDTFYLRGGVYHETVYLTRSGTAESPIVIAAYPGELPVLDGGLREFLESPDTSWEPLNDCTRGFQNGERHQIHRLKQLNPDRGASPAHPIPIDQFHEIPNRSIFSTLMGSKPKLLGCFRDIAPELRRFGSQYRNGPSPPDTPPPTSSRMTDDVKP